VAGYALALEADEEMPMERGLLLYVHVDDVVKAKPVVVGDSLRRLFSEEGAR